MAWEYLGDLQELSGDAGILTDPSQSWERILELVNEGTYYIPSTTGENFIAGSGDYYFPGGADVTKTTSWGLTITWKDSRQHASVGDFDFMSNVPVPGTSGYYGFSLGSLLYYGGFRIIVNHETEEIMIALAIVFYNSPYYTVVNILGNNFPHENKKALYDFVMAHVLSPYTWTSVKRLTGKGKTYRLTEILNINDGNPVDNVPRKTNLDFSAKSKVNNMVNELMPVAEDARKAIVRYEVPNANYEYCKIVYKKEHIPTSVTDGIAKTVDYDDAEVTITGLSEDTLYYFVVFTDKTESDPYRFKTGKQGGIFKMYIQTSKSLVENSFIENISYSKVTT